MNLQFLSGNPKRGKKRKQKALAKSKKKSTMKSMKKNPVTVSREKNGKMKKVGEFMTPAEIKAIGDAMKHGAKKGTKSQQLAMKKRVGKLMVNDAKKRRGVGKVVMAISKKNASNAQGGKPEIRTEMKAENDIKGALRKAGVTKYAKKNLKEKYLAKKAKAAKKDQKSAIKKRVMENLGLKSESELKERLNKLKGKTVAKKKRKKAKKVASKKRRVSRKVKTSKKRRISRKSKKVASKKRRISRKSRKASSKKRKHSRKASRKSSSRSGKYLKSVKAITVYAVNKKGKAKKIRTHKRPKGGKLSAYIKNPFGGAMKGLDKVNKIVKQSLGHSAIEAGSLFVAGGLLGAFEGAVTKYVSPHLSFVPEQIKPWLPSLGTMVAAGAAHYLAEEKLKGQAKEMVSELSKAVIAAALVKAGDQILGGSIKSAVGLSGVLAYPMGEIPQVRRGVSGMRGVVATPIGEVPRLSRGVSGLTKGDFDYSYSQSAADFGEIPRVMGGVMATPGADISTQSNVDFGRLGAMDPSSDESGDYEDSDVESMA